MTGQDPDLLMAMDANGYWSGFLDSASEGDTYRFYVVGAGSSGFKRDPYARELANDPGMPFPICAAVIRDAAEYPWHDAGFRPPEFSDRVAYQLHIGTYAPASPGWASTYLDVVEKLEYLVALGINVVQPLPVYEMEDSPSLGYPGLGYQGADLFSPAFDYAVYHPDSLQGYLKTINRLLAAKGFAPMTLEGHYAGVCADEGDGGPPACIRDRGGVRCRVQPRGRVGWDVYGACFRRTRRSAAWGRLQPLLLGPREYRRPGWEL